MLKKIFFSQNWFIIYYILLFNFMKTVYTSIIARSDQTNIEYFNNMTVPSISNQIKQEVMTILNITNNNWNETFDNELNLIDINPKYIFILPFDYYRITTIRSTSIEGGYSSQPLPATTVILRKTNFQQPIFPNVTFSRMIMKFKCTNLYKNINKFNNFKQKFNKNLSTNLEQFLNNNDLEESESMNVIDENVRTEQNIIERFYDRFSKFQHKSSHNLDFNNFGATDNRERFSEESSIQNPISDNKNLKNQKRIKIGTQQKKSSTDLQWKDFGLTGWSGTLRASPPSINKNIKDNPYRLFGTTEINYINKSFGRHRNEQKNTGISQSTSSENPSKLYLLSTFSTWTINSPEINKSNQYIESIISDSMKIMESKINVPVQLRELLTEERDELTNLTEAIKTEMNGFITSKRAAHKIEYVFIGRANNPFGHSTKWDLKNTTKNLEDSREKRSKRGVFELYSMIKCATGCDPLMYQGYGCYCGFLGSGIPLDGIDRCCQMHDYCYEIANCPMFLEYFVPYLWKCYRGRPLCAIDHGQWGGPDSCASRLCKCDEALSKCLRKYYCPRKRAVCTSSYWRTLQSTIIDLF